MAGTFKVKARDAGAVRKLKRLQGMFGNMQPILANAARELTRRIYYRFTVKRDPDGNKWKPWAPSTKERYKNDPSRKLMLHTRSTRDLTRFIAGRRDIRLTLGTPYAKFHEQTDGPGKGHIPRRAFIFSQKNGGRGLSDRDEKYLVNALQYQIRKATQ